MSRVPTNRPTTPVGMTFIRANLRQGFRKDKPVVAASILGGPSGWQ
jgi:hypothetical protein